MTGPKAYEWNYDRSSWDAVENASAFSVGVYQWLPKGPGQGVKKSKTIRVKGYVAEPERVYEKADELCRKLKKEKVRIDAPPSWLQKQYSVSKPAGYVKERIRDDLTGSQVRSARIKVMKQHLLPRGFRRGKGGTYVRRQDDQIHLIDFQASKWGHEYTVNLGVHFAFLPPFFHMKRISLDEYHILDCAIKQRIGRFIGDGLDRWFPYGGYREALEETLTENATVCLGIFEEYAPKWKRPEAWLPKLTKRKKLPARVYVPWDLHNEEFLVACLAVEAGEFELAADLLEALIEREQVDRFRKVYRRLLSRVTRESGRTRC